MKKKNITLNFSPIGENITILMEHCEMDATDLARETGLPTSTISRLRSNITDFSPNISSLIPIARYFEITVSQLIGEEPLPQDICKTFKPSVLKKQIIPLLKTEHIEKYVTDGDVITDSFLEIDLATSIKSFACLAQGSAMEPLFPDQSILIIDSELMTENHDFVLALSLKKKTILFRQLLTDGDDRYLKTLNPVFNDFVKVENDSHKIMGVVVQSRQNFKRIEHCLIVGDTE